MKEQSVVNLVNHLLQEHQMKIIKPTDLVPIEAVPALAAVSFEDRDRDRQRDRDSDRQRDRSSLATVSFEDRNRDRQRDRDRDRQRDRSRDKKQCNISNDMHAQIWKSAQPLPESIGEDIPCIFFFFGEVRSSNLKSS